MQSIEKVCLSAVVDHFRQADFAFPPMPRGEPLIDPSEPSEVSRVDNVNGDLIVYADSKLVDSEGRIYLMQSRIGAGNFGQVYSVVLLNPDSGPPVAYAMKISKSDATALGHFKYESEALAFLSCQAGDLASFFSSFQYQSHHCLVFDLLGPSLLDALARTGYQGLDLRVVQAALADLLDQLAFLADVGIAHCDVKPENILFVSDESSACKLIDFGSCCVPGSAAVTYTQSRYYRAPEVALGMDFDFEIDVWSAGCVAAELFLGLPLFPAQSQDHLLAMIDDMLGPFPLAMPRPLPPSNRRLPKFQSYFVDTRLDDIVMGFAGSGEKQEVEHRRMFLNLLHIMLQIDPTKRATAACAREHEFFSLEL
jgi:dual specificity protein kinase YAK1